MVQRYQQPAGVFIDFQWSIIKNHLSNKIIPQWLPGDTGAPHRRASIKHWAGFQGSLQGSLPAQAVWHRNSTWVFQRGQGHLLRTGGMCSHGPAGQMILSGTGQESQFPLTEQLHGWPPPTGEGRGDFFDMPLTQHGPISLPLDKTSVMPEIQRSCLTVASHTAI